MKREAAELLSIARELRALLDTPDFDAKSFWKSVGRRKWDKAAGDKRYRNWSGEPGKLLLVYSLEIPFTVMSKQMTEEIYRVIRKYADKELKKVIRLLGGSSAITSVGYGKSFDHGWYELLVFVKFREEWPIDLKPELKKLKYSTGWM
jgi:hypothetical protein